MSLAFAFELGEEVERRIVYFGLLSLILIKDWEIGRFLGDLKVDVVFW